MTKDNLRKRESLGLMISERKSIMMGCIAGGSCSRNVERSHINQTKETEQMKYGESVLWQGSTS